MITFPNAKINLGLNVIERRSDGFHNLETVFYPVPLSDILELVIDTTLPDGLEFSYSGLSIPGNEAENLCYKAYLLIKKEYKLPALKAHLHKVIPMGAGLGGGSADAAFFIKLLNDVCELNLTNEKMLTYAAQLGSDCSFFIENKTAYGTQRGEVLESIDFSLAGYFFVLIHPEIHVSTKDAFARLTPKKPKSNAKEILNTPIENWKNNLKNDFEESVFEKHLEIKNIKEKLYSYGALYSSMSGSGSAVYGLFKNEINLELEFKDVFYYSTFL